MYYEEKIINGVLCWRGTPDGEWEPFTAERLSARLVDAERELARDTPEGCKLVAHDTGDGWCLCVEDVDGNGVAMLEWPSVWPEAVSAKDLEQIGFEVN